MRTKWSDWRTYVPKRLLESRLSPSQVIGVVIGVVILATLITFVTLSPRSGQGGVSTSSSASFSAAATSSTTSSAATASGSTTTDSPGLYSAATGSTSTASKLGVSTPSSGHLVIETASIELSTAHLNNTANTITQITADNGGYVQSVQSSTPSQGESFENMTVRVPENQFQGVITNIQSLGAVRSFTQSGQDVTSNHNNLQAQITELQSEATAYTNLFTKATTMSDMLQIQKSLSEVNSQITNLNQQLHQLNGSIQFATIHVSLYPSAVVMPKTPQPFWIAAISSFHFMMRVGFDLLSALAWLLPWAVPVGVIWFIVYRLRRRRT